MQLTNGEEEANQPTVISGGFCFDDLLSLGPTFNKLVNIKEIKNIATKNANMNRRDNNSELQKTCWTFKKRQCTFLVVAEPLVWQSAAERDKKVSSHDPFTWAGGAPLQLAANFLLFVNRTARHNWPENDENKKRQSEKQPCSLLTEITAQQNNKQRFDVYRGMNRGLSNFSKLCTQRKCSKFHLSRISSRCSFPTSKK